MEEAYEQIDVSRATLFNWFKRAEAPPGKQKLDKLRRYLDTDAEWVLYGRTTPRQLKTGDRAATHVEETPARYEMVASRIPEQRAPATRQDCENYFEQYLDAAERDGDPNNFPEVMRRLRRQFKLDDWEDPPSATEEKQ